MTSNEQAVLSSAERDFTLNPRKLRAAGLIPATLYGKQFSPSLSLQVPRYDFDRLYEKGARSVVLKGYQDGLKVSFKNIQRNPVTRDVLNLELMPEG